MGDRLMVALVVTGVVAIILLAIAEATETEKHGGCAEYQRTGALTCWGGETWKHCEPDKVCVRYVDGTRPEASEK